ncbi:MAG: Dam family site-specific DNA-(adenine-N6)-methyltransferase [Nitrososphaera sp.]|nr:Dam family site-specific DNA-(adenine-N6)-methyltransferase [Nitrososphaera sp.]
MGRSKNVRESRAIPSLLKWTGSKRGQAKSIAEVMPHYSRFIEPFVGGGALLYLAATKGTLAGDIYEPLIAFWKLVQTAPSDLVADYRHKWEWLQKELRSLNGDALSKRSGLPKYYYKVRRRFNKTKNPLDLNFLMRTCVNGIVRFNHDGDFNNSFHLSRAGMTPERFEAVVKAWRNVVNDVTFVCQDYEKTVEEARRGDFVYFDPPYAGNHQRYIANLELTRFFAVLDWLNARGVKWALSFDGRRGKTNLTHNVPSGLYKRQIYLANGNSAVQKVLNGPVQEVHEALYLNY